MLSDIDYRDIEYRKVGFDKFYEFHCLTNDCSPDIAVEKWIADDMGFDFEKRCVLGLFHVHLMLVHASQCLLTVSQPSHQMFRG